MPQIPSTTVKPAGCQGTSVVQTLKLPSILLSYCFMCFKLNSVTLKTHELGFFSLFTYFFFLDLSPFFLWGNKKIEKNTLCTISETIYIANKAVKETNFCVLLGYPVLGSPKGLISNHSQHGYNIIV